MSDRTTRQDSARAPRVWRQDAGEALAPGVRTAQGFLLCQAIVARPGIYVYRDALGTERRELVPADELAKIDSLGSLGRAPVTLEHPDDDVSPDNVSSLAVGDADGDIIVTSGGYIKVSLAVRRKDALDAIQAGKQEVSPGYTCRLEQVSGVDPVHGAYDAIQRDRVYNHIAIVARARGGSEVRLRADRKDAAYQVTTPPLSGAQRPHQEARMALTADEMAQIRLLMGEAVRKDADDKIASVSREDLESLKSEIMKEIKDIIDAKLNEYEGESEDAPEDESRGDRKDKRKDADPHKLALELLSLREQAGERGVRLEGKETPAQLRKAIVLAAVPTARKDAQDAYYVTLMDALPCADSGALPVVEQGQLPLSSVPMQQRADSAALDMRSVALEAMRKMSV